MAQKSCSNSQLGGLSLVPLLPPLFSPLVPSVGGWGCCGFRSSAWRPSGRGPGGGVGGGGGDFPRGSCHRERTGEIKIHLIVSGVVKFKEALRGFL